MKIMLTGGKGMLGRTLGRELSDLEVIATDLPEADITDADNFNILLQKISPDVVIHCAAMTAVDKCESERLLAYKLNSDGTENVAKVCNQHHVRLIAISTDYVFDGKGERPWEPDDKCYAPLSVYGQTKLDGELAVSSILDKYFIVRIAWVFGLNGKNFIYFNREK